MLNIKYGPFLAEIFATTQEEFETEKIALMNKDYLPCSDYTEALKSFKQTFVKLEGQLKDFNLRYLDDYFFEIVIKEDQEIDYGIVNKIFDVDPPLMNKKQKTNNSFAIIKG